MVRELCCIAGKRRSVLVFWRYYLELVLAFGYGVLV
jgi:hypothetical protein